MKATKTRTNKAGADQEGIHKKLVLVVPRTRGRDNPTQGSGTVPVVHRTVHTRPTPARTKSPTVMGSREDHTGIKLSLLFVVVVVVAVVVVRKQDVTTTVIAMH
jgi:hypothetical protein